MAIDIGQKRTGIAVTDPLQLIATGLTTIAAKDLIVFLKTYLKTEIIDNFIVGEPKNLDNQPSHSAVYVKQAVNLLKKEFPLIPVTLLDERFTSKMAAQTTLDSGLKKKARQNKSLIDSISATILLQSYMAKENL